MSKSKKLFTQSQLLIPGGVNSPVRAFRNVDGEPFFVERGKGSKLYDVDGNCYVDYVGTWGPAILGHANEVVIEALQQQMLKGVAFGTPTELEWLMAERLCSWVPGLEKVRMVNSGTEATMSAIRLARGYTGRKRIIKFDGCYHGHADALLVAAGSGALTFGEPDSAGVPAEFAGLTSVLPYNDLPALEQAFASYGEQIAGVIVESYPANAGLYFPKPEFLQRLRELTRQYGSVLIFDEVMTGFRLARGGVQELLAYEADLVCMGKVIGGGLPVGAFGGKACIMDMLSPLGPVYQAGTLSGSPLAMAAGLAQLDYLHQHDAYARLEQIGARLQQGVERILAEKGLPWQFHRAGSMFCLFFSDRPVFDLASAKKADRELFKHYFYNMLERGVYMAPSPYETGFISLAHSEADIDHTLEAMQASL